MKRFNTTALCIPSKHYMVDLSERVREIKQLVDNGKYFIINRARQYGKTTTLRALQQALKDQYVVLSLSFEGIANAGYETEGEFVQSISRLILDRHEFYGMDIPDGTIAALNSFCDRDSSTVKMDELYREFRRWIARSDKGMILLLDEVDSATNNQVFLDFLGILRDGYIARESDGVPAFQSVVLAGVTDVKHLRSKIRSEDQHRANSPWNIATDFEVDMDFSAADIAGMLADYEVDHDTGMDVPLIAQCVADYTHGYPFLVSRVCQIMDEKLVGRGFESLADVWTPFGVDEAVRRLLSETNTLFGSLMGKLQNYPELRGKLRAMLMRGEQIPSVPDDFEQQQLLMYGFARLEHNKLVVANRIFEMRLYVFFVGESEADPGLRIAAGGR